MGGWLASLLVQLSTAWVGAELGKNDQVTIINIMGELRDTTKDFWSEQLACAVTELSVKSQACVERERGPPSKPAEYY